MMRRWCLLCVLMLLAQVATAAPGVHAFLDRNHVSLGDTVTLNIQSDGPIATPDLAPLQRDFAVLGSSQSTSVQIVNGKASRTAQLGIALKPLHAGSITIPALDIGGVKTRPLTVTVGAAPTAGIGKAGDPVFFEAEVQSASPYVGQQTVYTVRLFYLPDVDGAWGDPSVSGARLLPLERDQRFSMRRDGYAYNVIQRSWALIPTRSGPITVQGPEFQGQRMALGNSGAWFGNPNALPNNPNALLNGQLPGLGSPVRANAPAVQIDARAAPAGAVQPWLPAHDVQLQLTGLPANGKLDAGAPLTLSLRIQASGLPADALPEPELPPIAGAEVYPDQVQDHTNDSGEWLQGSRSRSFAIVPRRNGLLTIPAITLNWWNVASDRAERATVPAHTLQVSGVLAPVAGAGVPTAAAPVAARAARIASASAGGITTVWRTVALASMGLWLVALLAALAWWWWRKRRADIRVATTARLAARGADAVTGVREHASAADSHPRNSLLEAARNGDAAGCEHALLVWARATHAPLGNLGAVRDSLSDPAQREALNALHRARWRGGDARAACTAMADAFAQGFVWRPTPRAAGDDDQSLPPLYPP